MGNQDDPNPRIEALGYNILKDRGFYPDISYPSNPDGVSNWLKEDQICSNMIKNVQKTETIFLKSILDVDCNKTRNCLSKDISHKKARLETNTQMTTDLP